MIRLVLADDEIRRVVVLAVQINVMHDSERGETAAEGLLGDMDVRSSGPLFSR